MILRPARFRIRHDPEGKADREHRFDFHRDSGCIVVEIDEEVYFAITSAFAERLVVEIGKAAILGKGTISVFLNDKPAMCLGANAAQVFCRQLWGWCEVERQQALPIG